jgi:hypothetical protein
MSSAIEINGKKLLPIKEVLSNVSYTRDYVTRLAREGKIIASYVGRQWFVEPDSLVGYSEAKSLEQEIRNKQLREERKIEQAAHLALVGQKEKKQNREKYLPIKAVFASFMVATFGLMGGWSIYNITSIFSANNIPDINASSNLASVSVGDSMAQETFVASSTFSVNKISDDVSEGVLLLPEGSLDVEVTDLFSDEVQILTNNEGVQVVVKVDEKGMPVGNVMPFIKVPVKYSDR